MPAGILLLRLAWAYAALLCLYTACRILFVVHYSALLGIEGNWPPGLFLHGLRFDAAAILMSNLLFALVFTIRQTGHERIPRHVSRMLFVGVNGVFLLLFFIDLVYFPFIQKRLQADALLFLTGEKGGEFWTLLPVFLREYGLYWVGALLGVWLLDVIFRYVMQPVAGTVHRMPLTGKSSLVLGILMLHLFGMRGGWQLRPLGIMHATEAVGPEKAPAVMNTTFSLWRTLQKEVVTPSIYIPSSRLSLQDRGVHVPPSESAQQDTPLNVVILMVESLSTQFLQSEGKMTHTPFLDSLMGEGYYFPVTIANARESVQGVPAVLSSIPAWMDEPFLFSRYGTNRIESVASVLKPMGYKSYFFHGASTGTMGFDLYCRAAGFDHYVGKEQYPHAERDFDGGWGIWDHHFLPFMAQSLGRATEPFVAAVLTLNSHHPFRVPEGMAARFRTPGHPILTSINYVDTALKAFFEEARKQPWFHRTLFVITADHPGPGAIPFRPKVDQYRIPLLFYHPSGKWRGCRGTLASQLDIFPTVAGIVGVTTPFYSPGCNLFSANTQPAAITYQSGAFQAFGLSQRILFDGLRVTHCHDWHTDPLFTSSLGRTPLLPAESLALEAFVKKKIQAFHEAIVYDKMTASAYGVH